MKKITSPFALMMSSALVSGLSTALPAQANPFSANELASGYMQLAEAEMKCGANMKMDAPKTAEGACAGQKSVAKEGSCGASMKEGSCGAMMKKASEGSCGAQCADHMKNCAAAKNKEGACGAAMKGCGEKMQGCGEMMKSQDGSCGANKSDAPYKLHPAK